MTDDTFSAGEMILTGFRGQSLSETSLSFRKSLQEGEIGGVVYFDYDVASRQFGRNISSVQQVTDLSRSLRETAPFPLFIGIDEEGGKVSRLKSELGFLPTLSAKKQSETKQRTLYWKEQSEELYNLGINLNFAPCVDVETDGTYISKFERSFSKDVYQISLLAEEQIDIYRSSRVISCLKHFPGHGTALNTHEGVADITETFHRDELVPYQNIKADMVMIGHLFHRDVDDEYPASLSQKWINNILRNKLNFSGVVVSDDLDMKAVADLYSLEERVLSFIRASGDLILFGNNLSYREDLSHRIYRIITDNVSPDRIKESVLRIRKLKADFLM